MPRSFRSSAVRLGNRSASTAFSRNAASYCSRPSARSQSAMSIAPPGGSLCPPAEHCATRAELSRKELWQRFRSARSACWLMKRESYIDEVSDLCTCRFLHVAFAIGDLGDRTSLDAVLHNVDAIFYVALAFPPCET